MSPHIILRRSAVAVSSSHPIFAPHSTGLATRALSCIRPRIVAPSIPVLARNSPQRQIHSRTRLQKLEQRARIQFQRQIRNMSAGAAETDTQAAAVANTSGITEGSIAATLREKMQAGHVVVQDISGGCGQSFEAVIVSPQFEKKTTLARHRLVNAALKEEIAAIHAWTPRCFTPEEWEKRQAK